MTKRVFFRADKRSFKPNEPIVTAGQFMSKHPEKGRLAEAALEIARPSEKPELSPSIQSWAQGVIFATCFDSCEGPLCTFFSLILTS
jgi:hypothetical protein